MKIKPMSYCCDGMMHALLQHVLEVDSHHKDEEGSPAPRVVLYKHGKTAATSIITWDLWPLEYCPFCGEKLEVDDHPNPKAV